MRKYWHWIAIVLAVFLLIIIGVIYVLAPQKSNVIEDRIAALDPSKITGYVVEWATPNELFRYEETDPDKVAAMYEAICHMKFKEKEYEMYFGSHYAIMFIQDGTNMPTFSYIPGAPGTYVSASAVKFAADISNIDEINAAYCWESLVSEAVNKGIVVATFD